MEEEPVHRDPNLQAALGALVDQLKSARSLPTPNEPISTFEFQNADFFERWQARMTQSPPETIIEEARELQRQIAVPVLAGRDYEHLRIYHEISAVRDRAETLISEAKALGPPYYAPANASAAEL